MRIPRFHVPEAAPGARLELPEHLAHHAREVLRLKAGAAARIFDGRGHEFEATLEEVSRRTVAARLTSPVAARPESPLGLVLALPPLKGDRMETVIQKATELGVHEIRPVITTRTDAAARPALRGTRQDRWEKVASGAAEQCGRAVVPQIAPTSALPELIAERFDGARIMLHEGAEPLQRPPDRPASALVLVGPPGGFEDDEIHRASAGGFVCGSLGGRILRTETAAIAGVVLLQHWFGDLG